MTQCVAALTLCVVLFATGLGKLLDVAGFAAIPGKYRLLPAALLSEALPSEILRPGTPLEDVALASIALLAAGPRPWRKGGLA